MRLVASAISSSREQPVSLTTRLDEIRNFGETGAISQRQMREVYKALFKQFREKYGVPEIKQPQAPPPLSSRLKTLIPKLVRGTQENSIKWDPRSNSGPAAGDKEDSRKEPAPRTEPSRFVTKLEWPPNQEAIGPAQVEISRTNGFITLEILQSGDVVIQRVDPDTFAIEDEIQSEIGKLYELAKEAALKIPETLDALNKKLDKDLEKKAPATKPS